jgi:hypothetical protein
MTFFANSECLKNRNETKGTISLGYIDIYEHFPMG